MTEFVIWTTTPWTIPANLRNLCERRLMSMRSVAANDGKLIVARRVS